MDKHTYIYICILSGRKNVINMLSYLYVSCVTRINLDKHIYMHIEWKEKCDKYAIIFICKLCYKDKLGQTYLYAY